MAIWQFHIYFIPKKSLLNKYRVIPHQLVMDKECWDDYFQNTDLDTKPDFEDALTISWWLDLNINIDSFLPLVNNFGDIQSWSVNSYGQRRFGNAETNDISVCFDDNTKIVEEVSCRLDLRQFDKEFVDKTLLLASQFDCLLMDRQGRLYEPTLNSLLDTIKLSNANRFVNNPEQFFTDLSKGIVTPE